MPSILGVAQGLQEVMGVFCFRAVPVAAWAVLAPRMRAPVRIVGALTAVALVVAAFMSSRSLISGLTLAYGYFFVTASAVPLLAALVQRDRLSPAALFAVCAVAFFVAPALYAPGIGKAAMLLVGWDVMLSSYSYCIESARRCPVEPTVAAHDRRWPPALEDCLFFLLVNPALVYTQRGQKVGDPALSLLGLWRMTTGLFVIFLVTVLIRPLGETVKATLGAHSLAGTGLAGGILVSGFFALLLNYLQQSSVASLEIGMLRQCGYVVPERFNRPLLAAGPLDFWRRWNTYVGGWMQRYVFSPTSLRLTRGPLRVWPTWVSVAAGVLVTFAAVGILHDIVPYFSRLHPEARGLMVFLSAGTLVIVWSAAGRFADLPALSWLRMPVVCSSMRIVSRVMFALAMFTLFAWWTP
jgi:hypothetical protein